MTNTGLSAVQVLQRAIELEQEKKYSESLTCYEQGIRLLMQAAKEVPDAKKKEHYKKKIGEYLDRAEALKELSLQHKKQQQHTQIQIPEGDTGYSYSRLFGPYLDASLTSVTIRDPYIRSTGQLYNLQRFCEAVIFGAPNLHAIELLTSCDCNKPREKQKQLEGLEELRFALADCKVAFSYSFSDSLHDRDIRLDNGWTVQIGRGLDYFQRLGGNRFSIGSGDYSLRPCRETTIDIFHTSSLTSTPR
ncbi:MIT C-terminal phospholipase D-like domain [Trinorchestia longiramus]|nr:MIT C-terminal phospholipase D-like domain [Trinorchestia longiramus]